MQKNHTSTNEQENMYSDAELLSGCNLHTEFKFTKIQRSTPTKVRKEKVITQNMKFLYHLRSYNFIRECECQFVRIENITQSWRIKKKTYDVPKILYPFPTVSVSFPPGQQSCIQFKINT